MVMPSTVHTTMASAVPARAGTTSAARLPGAKREDSPFMLKKQMYAPTMMTSPWAKLSILAMP